MWAGIFCAVPQQFSCKLQNLMMLNTLQISIIIASWPISILSAFFTFVMLANQMNLIRKNSSTID